MDSGREAENSPSDNSVDSVLDDAYDRMARADFELANGFVNHGPMACEALAVLGRHDQIDGWASWFIDVVGEGPKPVAPDGLSQFDWSFALGDYQRLPEWMGFYDRLIEDSGWESTIEVWAPRLMPGLASALFHGVIRTAHALRAVSMSDTHARRAELARSLAYWSARFRPGEDVTNCGDVHQVRTEVITAAGFGASRYVTQPNIFNLHGVTGAMAVAILIDHLPPRAGYQALGQLRADHQAMYRGVEATVLAESTTWDEQWIDDAIKSRDAHQVKLVEACRRGFEESKDGSFAAAAERAVS